MAVELRWLARAEVHRGWKIGLKSAGHAAVPSAVQVASGVHKNTPKRSAVILIAQQHTQNWVDS
jgi:hypothetical protein